MSIKIGDRIIGPGNPVFLIAELSANHNGKIDIAKKTIKAAKKAGADAIKFQTYTPDTITIDSQKDYFKINEGTLWDGKYLYDLYKEAYTPYEWHEELFQTAKDEGLICFSSPFDFSAVDLLESLNTPAYKIASFEINDIPLIEYAASKGKPMIISTGIATEQDISEAIKACKRQKNDQIILLKCTSSYPAPIEEANLLTMKDFKERFGVDYGLSDHTTNNITAISSVALGACLIEKHFILDRSLGGPDASFSLDQSEFEKLVEDVRNAEASIGRVNYELTPKAEKNIKFTRSLFVVSDIKKGETLTPENVRSIRPSHGLKPEYYNQVLGMKASQNIEKGTPLSWDLINN
ncbi:MAG: pseudaminic acid synthase [Bacteroidota bacterium]